MKNPGGASPDEVTREQREQTVANDKSLAPNHERTTDLPPNLSREAWEKEKEQHKNLPWNSTVQGRSTIRLFSRGVMGALFFTIGSRWATSAMRDYHPGKSPENLPQGIAYSVDKLVGRPLEKIATRMGYDGKAFTTFRPTETYYGGTQHGRTLGHEVIGMTWDFATMSVGDALGRDIVGVFDPNNETTWIKDNHISYSNLINTVGKKAWNYLTYNAGEDWAVSIPYVFYNRWQRNTINKFSPGFGYDSDRRLNGGSFKVDKEGKVYGTFSKEGALDLQGKFTAYNIGTLMYREVYNEIGGHLKKWAKDDYRMPEMPGLGEAVAKAPDVISHGMKWAVRDVIKGALYMTPAVPAFWFFRTPQTKYRGAFINPEEGVIAYKWGKGEYDCGVVKANEIRRTSNKENGHFTTETPLFFSKFENNDWIHGPRVVKRSGPKGYPAYEDTYNSFDKVLNIPGKANEMLRKKLHKPLGIASEWLTGDRDLLNRQHRTKNFSDHYVRAAMAYTPYFFMKSDVMASYWDTAKMDMAIERAIDGVSGFKASEIKEGVGEIWRSMWHKPFDDPARELEAQRRICKDKSPADGQHFQIEAQCLNNAIDEVSRHKEYHEEADTRRFVERLKDSKKRASHLMNGVKEEVRRNVPIIGGDGATLYPPDRDESYLPDRGLHSPPDISRFSGRPSMNAGQYSERLRDSRDRASTMLDGLKQEAGAGFADKVSAEKHGRQPVPQYSGSFAEQEAQRQAADDFSNISPTIH